MCQMSVFMPSFLLLPLGVLELMKDTQVAGRFLLALSSEV